MEPDCRFSESHGFRFVHEEMSGLNFRAVDSERELLSRFEISTESMRSLILASSLKISDKASPMFDASAPPEA